MRLGKSGEAWEIGQAILAESTALFLADDLPTFTARISLARCFRTG